MPIKDRAETSQLASSMPHHQLSTRSFILQAQMMIQSLADVLFESKEGDYP